jgi:hypothetical protein
MSSGSEYMPANVFDLARQELIEALQLPQGTRRRLCRDAEKAKAAIDLWDYQNRVMEWVWRWLLVQGFCPC